MGLFLFPAVCDYTKLFHPSGIAHTDLENVEVSFRGDVEYV